MTTRKGVRVAKYPETTTVNIRLGWHKPVTGDPWGRSHIGAYPGMTPEDAWANGRGLWRLDAERVLQQDEAIVTNLDGIILAVAKITKVEKPDEAPERRAIEGILIPDDPRIGTASPNINSARNPISYA
jgi:hypothetical protein